MVFFTCGNCGESIKKPSIAKHYMGKCRGPPNVTCVDCLKDFRGDEYEAHIKCITEEERYSAKGFVAKPSSNKGEKKQQSWCDAMQAILDTNRNLRPDERELLTVLSSQENVPRKRAKFMNFISNAHRPYARRQELVERVWVIIEEAGKAATANTNGRNQPKESSDVQKTEKQDTVADTTTDADVSKKSKKKKREEEEASITEPSTDSSPSKKKKKKGSEENGDASVESTPVTNSTEKKKSKSSEKSEAVTTEASELTNGCNGTTDKKKKKRKAQDDEEAVGGKKAKNKINPVQKILEESEGSVSLYKLLKALTQRCASAAGPEKGEKILKKIQKQIIIENSDDKVIVKLDSLDNFIDADDSGVLANLITKC